MKVDVGMSHHEKREQEDAYTEVIHNPIPTSLSFNLLLVMDTYYRCML